MERNSFIFEDPFEAFGDLLVVVVVVFCTNYLFKNEKQ